MSKILVTLPPDMHQALKDISDKRDTPQSVIVRRALATWIEWETGVQYEWKMKRGGDRIAASNGADSK